MKIRLSIAVALLIASVAGCGGGGSGSTKSDTGSTSSVFNTEPSLPSLSYTGKTSAAALSTQGVGDIAQRVFSAITFANSAINNYSGSDPFNGFGSGVVNLTQSGSLGGDVTIQGNVSAHSSDKWLVETFTHYAYQVTDGGGTQRYVANGTIIVEGSSSKDSVNVTFGYKDYNLVASGLDITYNGTLALELSLAQANYGQQTLDLNLGVHDIRDNMDLEFANFSMQAQPALSPLSSLITTSVSGRLYEQDIGYLDLASDGTADYWQSSNGYYYPVSGGDLVITGADGAVSRIEPLNYGLFSASLQTGGTSTVVQATRFEWNTFAPDIAATSSDGPVADAYTRNGDQITVGQPVTVDGGYSHSPDGALLTYQWTLQFAPPGSTAVLTRDNGPEAVFTPDLPGDYMLQLTVTDGTHSSTDHVDVSTTWASSDGVIPELAGMSVLDIEPVSKGSVGTPIQLHVFTGQDLMDVSGLTFTYNWSLTAPTGSTATLSDPGSVTPSFTPDVPGFYTVSYTITSNNGEVWQGQTRAIDVGEDISFDPPMQLTSYTFNDFYDSLVVADLNGDNRPDVIFADASNNPSPALYVLMNEGNGKFAAPSVIDFTSAPNGLAVGDLDGDGRPDIAVTFDSSIEVFLQASDGSFGTKTTLSYPGCTTFDPEVSITKLFGASTNSLVVEGCSTGLQTWSYSSGAFTSAATVNPVTGTGNYLQYPVLGDATGDGIIDAVGAGVYNSQSGELVVPGQSGSGFGTPQVFTGLSGAPLVTDLDGDSNPDLVAGASTVTSTGTTLNVFYGTGSGLASTAVTYPLSERATQILAADINGDGRKDVVTQLTSGLGIFEQQADHTLGSEIMFALPTNDVSTSQSVWVTDINGDGIPDIVTFTGRNLVVYYGNRD